MIQLKKLVKMTLPLTVETMMGNVEVRQSLLSFKTF